MTRNITAILTGISAPNVGARKLKALIFYTINPLLYDIRSVCVFEHIFGGLGAMYAVHLRLIGSPKWTSY